MKLYFLFAFVAIACGSKDSRPDKVDPPSLSASKLEFVEFVEKLPMLTLPYEIYCLDCCGNRGNNPNDPLIKKYIPEGASLIGVIFKNRMYVGILVSYPADLIVPSVVVYDVTGRITDEKTFMGSLCEREHDQMGLQYFHISEKIMLSEIDTTYLFALDSTNNILDTTNTEISRKDFKIDNIGKIVVINKK